VTETGCSRGLQCWGVSALPPTRSWSGAQPPPFPPCAPSGRVIDNKHSYRDRSTTYLQGECSYRPLSIVTEGRRRWRISVGGVLVLKNLRASAKRFTTRLYRHIFKLTAKR
jgi:hypothetical protein